MKRLNILILKDPEEMALKACEMFIEQIGRKKKSVIGFASGNTMIPVYKEIVKAYKAGKVDFSGITTFNLDEYAGLDGKNKESFRRYMDRNLFDKVNIGKKQVNFLNGKAGDLDGECARYEKEISKVGGIDFQFLGLGRNGHIAFDEPGSSLRSRTRVIELSLSTRKANSKPFGGKKEIVPRLALTMGVGTILEAKKMVLVATGEHKADAVRCMIKGKIGKNCPASVLRRHEDVTILLDRKAAGKL